MDMMFAQVERSLILIVIITLLLIVKQQPTQIEAFLAWSRRKWKQ